MWKHYQTVSLSVTMVAVLMAMGKEGLILYIRVQNVAMKFVVNARLMELTEDILSIWS